MGPPYSGRLDSDSATRGVTASTAPFDPPGIRTLCAYLLLREKIIKPLLAGIVCPRGPRPRHHTALDEHYIVLRRQLRQTFQFIGLTAT
jgi:hypothetical protein